MKHIKLFNEDSEYQEYLASDSVFPNVSHCIAEDHVHYNPVDPDPYRGHEYVDLGLPSGTLWATTNIGAMSETDYGNYYMYGMGSKTYDNADTPYAGRENPLSLSVDTAAQVWGGEWHTPTTLQIQELIANTTYQWITDYNGSGVNGGLFTAQNGNSVFFPAAGNYSHGNLLYEGNSGTYWSSTPRDNISGYGLDFNNSNKGVTTILFEGGFSIHPVIG